MEHVSEDAFERVRERNEKGSSNQRMETCAKERDTEHSAHSARESKNERANNRAKEWNRAKDNRNSERMSD